MINWRPISEFNKAQDGTDYLFYIAYQAYEYAVVGSYYLCRYDNGAVEELIDTGFAIEPSPCFRYVTHFSEINEPDV